MEDTRARQRAPDLQGWKEIATYMGRSVRAAQRWERELGLPVRRLKTVAGQTVFARRAEIDAWRESHEIPSAGGDSSVEDSLETPSDEPLRRRPPYWGVATIAILAVLVAARFGARNGRGSAPDSTDFELKGNRLIARDAAGHEIWSHVFPHRLMTLSPHDIRHLHQIQRADLDGDGRPEVLVVTVYDVADGIRPDTMWCFSENGRLLWSFEPSGKLVFKDRAYDGTWSITDLVAAAGPGPQRVWLSAAASPWWPSMVVEVDKSGRGRTVYIQSGVVYSLAASNAGERLRLWAGGINNEYARASAALLDPELTATSPQTPGSAYKCSNCVPDGPLEYVLFPRSELNVAVGQPYNRVTAVDQEASGKVRFYAYEGEMANVTILYEREPSGVFVSSPTDTYWLSHENLSRTGVLPHSVHDCPDLKSARTLRVWTPARGWSDVPEQAHALAAPGLPR